MSRQPLKVSDATFEAVRKVLTPWPSAMRVAQARVGASVWLAVLMELEGRPVAAGLAYELADELVT